MLENKALIEPLRIFGVFLFVLCDINTWPRNLLSLKRMKIFKSLFWYTDINSSCFISVSHLKNNKVGLFFLGFALQL